ncbi:MAG: hypothetical protein JW882_18415 [Deltaproteobacteria bacterium]|nr:hypothetical protein [Deltaproteobacteria bacterium]
MELLKKIIIFGIIAAVIYFLISYHYIMNGMNVKPLKKSIRTLKYTVYNVKGKDPERILKIKELREDGIGELLVEMGIISEDELESLEEKIEEESD